MDISKDQSKLIVQGIQHVTDGMRITTNNPTLSPNARKALAQDIEELDEIKEFIENKAFSIAVFIEPEC